MRRVLIGLVAAALLALAAFWYFGGVARLELWALEMQRQTQSVMARALRALRAGEPGALAGLFSVAFTYGFVHAAGPGHGKFLLAGYGAARRTGFLRLSLLALVSSLAQAAAAVLLVYAGIFLLGWGRDRLAATADGALALMGNAMILLLGLWLLLRGLRGLGRMLPKLGQRADKAEARHSGAAHRPSPAAQDHGVSQAFEHGAEGTQAGHHHHHHDAHCGCGHAHMPDPEALARAGTWREQAALILGVALRPCTGAVFILILTWQMGIAGAGIMAAFVMGLGTASVTAAVALGTGLIREGALRSLSNSRTLALAVPTIEIGVGLLLALVSAGLLMRGL